MFASLPRTTVILSRRLTFLACRHKLLPCRHPQTAGDRLAVFHVHQPTSTRPLRLLL